MVLHVPLPLDLFQQSMESSRATKVASLAASFRENHTWQCLRTSMLVVLGVLLRDNIAHPWASVLPHYRKKHLLVTTLIALFFLGIPMFSMEFVGTSDIAPTSVAVIFLTCLAAGLWTLHHPVLGFLAFPFLVFAMAPSSSSPDLAAFLAGTNPAASAALVFMSLLALWALAWRLLALNEDSV